MSTEFCNSEQSTINDQISYISDQIYSEILTFIKTNKSNLNLVLQKLISLYKYIKNGLFNENEEQFYPVTDNLSGIYNPPLSPNCAYMVNKLKRKLKVEHRENKLREMSYLEKLCSLRNEIKCFENEKETNIKKNKKRDNLVLFSTLKSDTKKHYSFSSFKKKKNAKKNAKKNGIRDSNSLDIFPLTTVNNMKIDEKAKTGNNFYDSGFDLNGEEMNNYHNNTVNSFLDKYRIKMYSKSVKKIKNINKFQKYDFQEIKKSVEDGKKKIQSIKDSISPVLFSLRNIRIGKS